MKIYRCRICRNKRPGRLIFRSNKKTFQNPSKPIGFMYSPLWKIIHQKPSVLCTPPFEKSPIKSHRFCVLPPLKNHCFWWAFISGWAFISANTVCFIEIWEANKIVEWSNSEKSMNQCKKTSRQYDEKKKGRGVNNNGEKRFHLPHRSPKKANQKRSKKSTRRRQEESAEMMKKKETKQWNKMGNPLTTQHKGLSWWLNHHWIKQQNGIRPEESIRNLRRIHSPSTSGFTSTLTVAASVLARLLFPGWLFFAAAAAAFTALSAIFLRIATKYDEPTASNHSSSTRHRSRM